MHPRQFVLVFMLLAGACGGAPSDPAPIATAESDEAAGPSDTPWPVGAWALVEQEEAGSPIAGQPITLELLDDGRLAGHAGCNRYFAEATPGPDGGIAIGPVGATRMACEPEVMDRETAFFGRLDRVARWSRDGDHLLLLDGDDAEVLRFSPAGEDGPPS